MAQMGNGGYSPSNYGTRNYNSGLNTFKYGIIAVSYTHLRAHET